MLLGHQLLTIAKTWLYREKIELEAAAAFGYLSRELEAVGAPLVLMEMAERAGRDEAEHAGLCRAIVERLAPDLEPLEPNTSGVILPADDSIQDRARAALYASMALSCVTETLSAALLIEMRKLTEDSEIRATIQRILKDEIEHGRIGWAHLAWEAERGDVSWLGPYLSGMIRAALATQNESLKSLPPDAETMGILVPERSRRILETTFHEVVLPGVELYGIDTARARDTLNDSG